MSEDTRRARWLPVRTRGAGIALLVVWMVLFLVQTFAIVVALSDGEEVRWFQWVAAALPALIAAWYWVAVIYLMRQQRQQPPQTPPEDR